MFFITKTLPAKYKGSDLRKDDAGIWTFPVCPDAAGYQQSPVIKMLDRSVNERQDSVRFKIAAFKNDGTQSPQIQKENGKPASVFLFKPLLEEKPQLSFYRPAA